MKYLTGSFFLGLLLMVSSCGEEEKESFAYGNFESNDLLIPSETSGLIIHLDVNQGDEIRKDSRIALIDTSQYHLQKQQVLASRKAVLATLPQLEAEIRVQEVNISNLERELKRFASLFLENAATASQIDDIEGRLELARAQLNSLKTRKLSVYAERDAKDAQLRQIEDQIHRSFIAAPIDGQILEIFLNGGEMAVTGRPVAKLANLKELILRVFIEGDQLSSIKLNDKVRVLFDGPEGLESTEGKISWISPRAEFTPKIIQTRENRVNLVYAVKVSVPNDGRIKIGMPGEIQLISNTQ
ncbi:MAG: HlyD family secretion protein [Bacteroidota bacterium]